MKENVTKNPEFFSQMERWYLRKVANFSKEKRHRKIKEIQDVLSILSLMLKSSSNFCFEKRQYVVLKWKLAQYFQSHEKIDVDEVYESMLKYPIFLENKDRITSAIEIFKKNKRKEIREKRKQENLSTHASPEVVIGPTSSGYLLVRLVNWSHLDHESQTLQHCVAKSDFYISRIIRDDYEVFSLRTLANISVATIAYNKKSNKIEQIRKFGDKLIKGDECFYPSLVESLIKLKKIKGFNKGGIEIEAKELRNISSIENSLIKKLKNSFNREAGLSVKIINNNFNKMKVINVLKNRNYHIPKDSLCFINSICLGMIKAKFIELSLFDLGLNQKKTTTYKQVCDIALNLGYSLCSTQEAFAYAVSFPIQENYSFYFFGMDLNDGSQSSFITIGNNAEQNVLFLHGSYGKETQIFNVNNCIEYDYKFIFKIKNSQRRG
jgi:hypothetical protein